MKKTSHKFLAATLLIGSSLTGVHAAFAQSAPAGTPISNTATATYKDSANKDYNATSNTVIVNVAEVPGINVSAQSLPPSAATATGGDTIFVDFIITNVGNDATQFFIPGTVTLSDGTNFSVAADSMQIIAVNGTTLTNAVTIPAAGDTTGNLLSATNQGSIAVKQDNVPNSGTVTVRVPVQIKGTAPANATTTVALGNTGTGSDQNRQNIARTTADDNDVRTKDNPDGTTNETAGVPIQESEAMATSAPIVVNARLQAFATILKAKSDYSNNSTPAILSDDTLTYALALRVDNPTGITGLAASDLHPTAINLDGGTANVSRVLISDAIPARTVLSSTTPTVPDNTWQVVYTTSDLSIPAHKANWNTTRPSGTITRVGFIRATAVTKGSTANDFLFSVNPVSGFTGGEIANIAQVFGQSQSGTPVAGSPTQLVYDESGDQSANNQLQGGNPDPTSGGAPDTGLGIGNGVADPSVDGRDTGRGTNPTDTATTNLGSTTDTDGGEDLVVTIAATPLNGPNGRPDAVNTTNNDDFTNQSIVLDPGLNPTTLLTDAQTPATTFTNTVQNTSGSPQTLSLLPSPPVTAGDLPTGTIVTITAGTDIAVYEYNGTQFVFQAAGSSNTSATDPVKLVNLAANDNAAGGADQANYTVTVNLPAGVGQTQGFPVPILAFVDENNDGLATNEPSNITIDRLYTGYVKLDKDARILEENGDEVVGFTTVQTALSAAARPRRLIEYRIQYRNVSTPADPDGSGNFELPANNLIITEDGNTIPSNPSNPNNWFASTDDTNLPAANGSATVSQGSVAVTRNSGDIQIYTNTIDPLAPGASGTFTFRRKIN